MKKNPLADFIEGDNSPENYEHFDLHRPFVDEIYLVSDSGKKCSAKLISLTDGSTPEQCLMRRYIILSKTKIISVKCSRPIMLPKVLTRPGLVFYTSCHSNHDFRFSRFQKYHFERLVLDKNGNKMSKRLGNAVDAFSTIEEYGSDPLRWYMITNSQPWII